MNHPIVSLPERRSFLTRLNAGAAALAAVTFGGRAVAQVKSAPARFEPAGHDQDNWMDQIAGKHRVVFDAVTNTALGDALLFATNYLTANRTDYGLQNGDLAVIVIARHMATALGFNDAMWAKYGTQMAPMTQIDTPSKTNPRNSGGLSLDSLARQGVRFAVCGMAARRVAGSIAQATGGDTEKILAELAANLVSNARLVPAGIVAVNRAQEHGYTLVTA